MSASTEFDESPSAPTTSVESTAGAVQRREPDAPPTGGRYPDDGKADDRSWDGMWLLHWREVGVLLVALAGVIGVGAFVGLLMTDWTAPNAITRLDDRVAEAFVDSRTDVLNGVVPWAAFPADTFTKIGISAVICGFFLWRFRRWDEAVYVALPLVFEATAFVTITTIVARPRPDVEALLESTINSSYPSGHVAAATVYAAVAVVVFRHTGNVWARTTAVVLVTLIVLAVSWARLYQGMHFLSDVIAGVVLGATSVAITDRVLHHAAIGPHATPRPALGVRSGASRD